MKALTYLLAPLMFLLGCTTSAQEKELESALLQMVRPHQESWLKGTVSTPDEAAINRIVVFGDSLSDIGRLRKRTLFVYPPEVYWRSRASNGPIWIDYVSQALGWKTTNYAVAGAATEAPWLKSLFIPSLQDQVGSFQDDAGKAMQRHVLAVIWIGPNNYLADPDAGDVSQTLKDMEIAIRQLLQSGIKHFMIGTMPELSGLPAYRHPSAAAHDRKLGDYTRAHNRALKDLIQKLEQERPDERFAFFQAYDINRATLQRPAEFGFRNITHACYNGDYLGRFPGQPGFCQQPSAYKFWDQVHPTSKMHCYYAAQFLTDLDDHKYVKNTETSEALTRCRKL
ncbi:SGNH/GDSL hydrolase family protein [Oligoflexus tunisiensis]|uniref:SGNH/GDSL hydrolase family protein n=1 Tax=Oligoflexus tunisiensis TaxID=708132 RepID=UPI000B1AA221|nr:SGNH/GDSL hydrolase family protein [Oligoflexus tunisiensis]